MLWRRGAAIFLIQLALVANVWAAPSGNGGFVDDDEATVAGQQDGSGDPNATGSGFKRSTIRTTVVNLNDSNADDLFRNFNVSKDEIYRRLAQRTSAETMSAATPATNSNTERRNDEES